MEALIGKLVERAPLPKLRPTQVWNSALTAEISALKISDVAKAGLHLWNDDLESCHLLVQELDTADAAYWHALMHRREGDVANSLYWYARVGKHPVLAQMRKQFPDWTPEAFGGELELAFEMRQLLAKALGRAW